MSKKQQEQNKKVPATFYHIYADLSLEKEYYVFMMIEGGSLMRKSAQDLMEKQELRSYLQFHTGNCGVVQLLLQMEKII